MQIDQAIEKSFEKNDDFLAYALFVVMLLRIVISEHSHVSHVKYFFVDMHSINRFVSLLQVASILFGWKIFFQKPAICSWENHCEIDVNNRRICSACRLGKCFSSGMQMEMIRSPQNRLQKLPEKKKSIINHISPTPVRFVCRECIHRFFFTSI